MPRIAQAKEFIVRYERILSPLALLGGFVVDSLTLRRVDLLPETLLLVSYLLTVGGAIILLHLIEAGIVRGFIARFIRPYIPLVIQFTYGSLFSAFLIFYSKSAAISQSWPFLAILLAVSVGTEVFRTYNQRLTFQVSIFYFALFSFCIFSVPLVAGGLGTHIFLISGAVSAIVFGVYFVVLYLISPSRLEMSARKIIISAAAIYVAVNSLYFMNVLPPIPLALKDIGIYHNVEKVADGYRVTGESYPWPSLLLSRQVLHLVEGEPVFAFSSVFAPVAIDTDVVHTWEYWSELEDDWVLTGEVSFPVIGGRDGGYRGFSYKRGVFPGIWRVSVETPGGQRIGQVDFEIVFYSQAPELVSEVLR